LFLNLLVRYLNHPLKEPLKKPVTKLLSYPASYNLIPRSYPTSLNTSYQTFHLFSQPTSHPFKHPTSQPSAQSDISSFLVALFLALLPILTPLITLGCIRTKRGEKKKKKIFRNIWVPTLPTAQCHFWVEQGVFSETLDMTSEGLGVMFEGDYEDRCTHKNSDCVEGVGGGPIKCAQAGSEDPHPRMWNNTIIFILMNTTFNLESPFSM
jgi:hypothetical protein